VENEKSLIFDRCTSRSSLDRRELPRRRSFVWTSFQLPQETLSMTHSSRRNFVFLSSGAAIGSMLVNGLAEADDAQHAEDHHQNFAHSGLVTGSPKPLKHKSIPGFLSAE
jgi:hypothetical protein